MVLRIVSDVLIGSGLLGLALTALLVLSPSLPILTPAPSSPGEAGGRALDAPASLPPVPWPELLGGPDEGLAAESGELAAPSADALEAARAAPAVPAPWRAITRLRVASIKLDSEVVPSKFVVEPEGATWEIPAFKPGHAERTAGAGEVGNAVLLGHLTSLTLGSIFKDLNRVRVGDLVEVWSDAEPFTYRVVKTWIVPRFEVAVLNPTETASLTLLTCAGRWLPREQDYEDRLVVRAELIETATS